MFPFGKDISFLHVPLADDELVAISSALQTQTPSIWVFSTLPSRAAAASGEGAIGSEITSWTWDPTQNGWTFTIPAIDDPFPTSTKGSETYYLGINFLLQVSEQIQTIVRALELQRVRSHHKRLEVRVPDLEQYYPKLIGVCCTESEAGTFIVQSISAVKAKLKAAGYEWSLINRPDRLKDAVVLKALSLIMLSLTQSPNDKFAFKYAEYNQNYKDFIASLIVEYDSDNDGESDSVIENSGVLFVIR